LVSRSRLHRPGQVPALNAFPDFGLSVGVTGSDLSARFADRMALHGFECMHVISQRDSHHWTLATLTGTVLLRDK
jgi:hypothetical protein